MDSVKPSVTVQTFGCKVNTYDSGLLQSRLKQAGFSIEAAKGSNDGGPTEFSAGRRVHVLNSCAVTQEASKEVVRVARKLKREDESSVVIVTGCAAQVDTELYENQTPIDLIVANSHKGQLAELLQEHLSGHGKQKIFKNQIFKKEDLEAGYGEELEHTRSFLKIQDGCDSFCTFCVIPFARGKSRSISPEDLSQRINHLHSLGNQEIVLTGVHIGDYQGPEQENLAELLKYLLKNTRVPRFRLSSLEPIELTQELMEVFKEPRVCPHFHMSIQSGSTTVLSRMKRKYDQQAVSQSLRLIASEIPNAFVGMDVIAGFPEETEEEFLETWQCLAETPWTRLHVFPYSSRPYTFAARLPQLAPEVVHNRAARLRELSAERLHQAAVRQNQTVKEVLVLKSGAGQNGLSRDYWSVLLDQPQSAGAQVLVRITGVETENAKLYGRVLNRL